MQMLAGGIILAVMAVATGEPARLDLPAVSPESLTALGYLTVVGSLVAFTAYGWLLRVAPLSIVATYAYVNPVVAVVLGAIVLGEEITFRTLTAGAVIIFAVALIISARSRMSAPRRTSTAEASADAAAARSAAGAHAG
jgi:drug/metabolite transporter (DMT)-like permease